jgi:hypothetical protein
MVTSTPVTRVPREATQPPADDLLSYDDVLARLATLAGNPRVRLRYIGTTHQGRAIPMIVVTSPDAADRLDYHQAVAARLAGPTISHTSVAEPREIGEQLTSLPSDARLPVLIAGASFGFEASHVEALVELAETLAADDGPAVREILATTVVLIVPLMNPDGRELSIREWRSHRLSSGSTGVGNHYHILINRDFRHLSQPESQAIARVVNEWHPFVLWDVHEDAYVLGWKFEEVCLCPPTEFDAPRGIDPVVQDEAKRFGAAIAAAWERAGFNYLYHPEGRHGWITTPADEPDAMSGSTGRITLAMGVRGIPSFITESARTNGAQTWEDRNREKVTAGLAILETVAQDPDRLAGSVRAVRQRAFADGAADGGFFLIPGDQPPDRIAETVRVLRGHGIAIYQATNRPDHLVVPEGQPECHAIEALLSYDYAEHDALTAAFGVRVVPSRALDPGERDGWQREPLTPIAFRDVPSRDLVLAVPASNRIAVPNVHDGVMLINRLLRTPGCAVRWDPGPAGGFVVDLGGSRSVLEDAASDLAVELAPASPGAAGTAVELRRPRVGLYAGQGVNVAEAASFGSLRWLLHRWEFSPALMEAEHLTEDVLSNIDILIVPNGDAGQIVHGWNGEALWYREPWELPGTPRPLAPAEVAAVRAFVEGGGHYLGLDAGGGILAGPLFLGLLDFEVAANNLGLGLVDLRIAEPPSALFAGLAGSWDRTGRWRDGILPALYWSERFSAIDGGSVFRAGSGTRVLASYAAAHPVPGPPNLVHVERLTVPGADAAIIAGDVGNGRVTVSGIEPSFRCYWSSTFRLISNAIFDAATVR